MGPGQSSNRLGIGIVILGATVLSGCSLLFGGSDRGPTILGKPPVPEASLNRVERAADFEGAVAGDEPRAVRVGRDVLAVGGNAADAAVATYFALAVTLPSQASLGGGGVCLVVDPRRDGPEVLEFYARSTPELRRGTARPTAVPGNPRGFQALHARYGVLRWQRLIAPAEQLARLGIPVSRAFAADLEVTARFLLADEAASKLFTRDDGFILDEGDPLVQVDLADVLAGIRLRGGDTLNQGILASQLVDAATAAGSVLTLEALNAMQPRWRAAVTVPVGAFLVSAPPPPAAAGMVAAQIFAMLADDPGFPGMTRAQRTHLFAEASMLALLERRRWEKAAGNDPAAAAAVFAENTLRRLTRRISVRDHTPAERIAPNVEGELENPAGTGFVITDADGMTVACTITPNNPFGVGRVAPGTGVVLAVAPGVTRGGPRSLGPVIVRDLESKAFVLAMAGAGGVAYPTAMAWAMLGVLVEGQLLDPAVGRARLHHSGSPDTLYHEARESLELLRRLEGAGHNLRPFPSADQRHPARLNGIHCRGGLEQRRGACVSVSDPRGYGIGYGSL